MPSAPVLHRKTITAEPIDRAWYIADVEGLTLGRAATKIAAVLCGKHRARFVPHQDSGDFVVVVNADKVKLTLKAEGYAPTDVEVEANQDNTVTAKLTPKAAVTTHGHVKPPVGPGDKPADAIETPTF